MQLSDVLIHINEIPDKSEQQKLFDQPRNLEDVIAPGFSSEKDNFLFVSYNTKAINTAALLARVKENGFKAQLAGL